MAKKKGKKSAEQLEDPGIVSLSKPATIQSYPNSSFPTATDSTTHMDGTGSVQLRPYIETFGDSHSTKDQYEAISAQPECMGFSHEELRLADYRHGVGVLQEIPCSSSDVTSPLTVQSRPGTNSTKCKSHLDLFRGPGIEIHVGTTITMENISNNDTHNVWSLPRALISYHSPFLEAACSRYFKECRENRIKLLDDDTTVFALFVEWMYYGQYTIASLSPPSASTASRASIDAKCWVLGDKLLCIGFKNYAMGRIYAQHTATSFNTAVTTSDVEYACDNSAMHSKLREFYVTFAATYFNNPNRIHGSAEEWDGLFLKCADMRLLLLQGFRLGDRDFLKSEGHYFDKDDKVCVVIDRK